MLTNRLNLPQAIVLAVQNDPYTKGDSDISVTQLISPPYQRKLKETVEPIEDVADKLYSLYGQLIHLLLERAGLKAGLDVETRLYAEVNGWTVSGQYDLYEATTLFDYKFTSYWSVKSPVPKKEWVAQLNLLRLLAIRNGKELDSLRIIAMLRDHSFTQAERDGSYPQSPVATVDIPVWDIAEAEEYLLERVRAHQAENPPPCSDEERWLEPAVFALKKKGRKTAIKLFQDHDSAALAAEGLPDHFVEVRPGKYRRCQNYCNVSHGCPVWQKHKGLTLVPERSGE